MFSSSNGSFNTSCSFICTKTSSHNNSRHSQHHSSTSTATPYHNYGSNVNVAIEVTTTGPEELKNRKYKSKCAKLQKQIREMVFLNSALDAEVIECHQRLNRANDERRFLLNKILQSQKEVYHEASSRILQQALSK